MATETLEATRNARVATTLNALLTREAPVAATAPVDILSGSDNEAVNFTSAWETED
ncbi:hypothetical protein OIB37_04855 [Streptomyces sp. NBC_00820]|uniref:hypothetical protein n=1 Tax=Streptomyces sp. NBC_00820 TaxID=2975842 RepID=UPI002ED47760|nr:hypothetical protein OIB37_04855 [Streptomyces sp. NBC_00820]